jgi:photosystem II stability/assembly factor-like uncharacterized protein
MFTSIIYFNLRNADTMKIPLFILVICLTTIGTVHVAAQQIQTLTSGNKISIRGLSVVNDNIIWASGSKGSVAKSVDAGKTWEWMTVKNFEQRDFRDIEAFDANTAIIMAISEPANILKTIDGGKSWKIVFTDTTKGMFLDAMDFYDKDNGIVVGDPVNDTVFLAVTNDNGNNWKPLTQTRIKSSEGFFASSGTNIRYAADGSFMMVSGGKKSRLMGPNQPLAIEMILGKESTGANSIALWGDHAVIVGGDFSNDKDTIQNCLVSIDNTHGWVHPSIPPHGYRSCVEYVTRDHLITCGTSGVDISTDGGMNWKLISGESFHVCRKAKKGKAVFLAGSNGKIAKFNW